MIRTKFLTLLIGSYFQETNGICNGNKGKKLLVLFLIFYETLKLKK